MHYPALKPSDATLVLLSRGTDQPVDAQRYVSIRGSGPEFDDTFVGGLKAELSRIRAGFPAEFTKGSKQPAEFESATSEFVHQLVSVPPEIQADPDFWTWLAVVHFADLIEWRYGAKPGAADLKNFGIGTRGENFLFRLWLRGDVGLDASAKDKYHLVRRGQVDFWRSHVFRQRYANARTFARTLIRFQYPDNCDKPRLKISAIRELVKRLRRVKTNLVIEMLDEEKSLDLIQEELSALADATATATA
jgi:hypothetical protein